MNDNIILDTNAFVYLMNIEQGKTNTMCIEKKTVDDKRFYWLCRNANHLFITGQSLYELFWQSIRNTNDFQDFAVLYDAIAKYRRIYNVNFSVLNDEDGIFDLKLFQEQYKNNKVDTRYFIEQKRRYECEKIKTLLYTLYISAIATILDYYNIYIPENYYGNITNYIESELNEISKKYYSNIGISNRDYDKKIELILGKVWNDTINEIAIKENILLKKFPDVEYNGSGTDYMHKLFFEIKKFDSSIFIRFDETLDEIVENIKLRRGGKEESCLYLKRICKRSIYDRVKIRKNDGIDYSIMTCLAKEKIINETDKDIDLINTFSLTFDANLYNFSKENSVLYKKEIYDELLK